MNVYVESNFVLELALLQEQSGSCEEILSLAEGVDLLPVFWAIRSEKIPGGSH